MWRFLLRKLFGIRAGPNSIEPVKENVIAVKRGSREEKIYAAKN